HSARLAPFCEGFRAESARKPSQKAFANEADTDFTDPVNRRWIGDALAHWYSPCRVRATPTVADVDRAVARAKEAASDWQSRPSEERAAILRRVAREMSDARGA